MDDRNQSRVVFGGDEARPVFMSSQKKTSKMVQFVIAHTGGVIKNQSQAEKFLLVVMLVAIILGFFSSSIFGPGELEQKKLTPEMLKNIENMRPK